MNTRSSPILLSKARLAAWGGLACALAFFFVLSAYQLDLPGLHYDEAKEAGLNAMELVTWRPLTAFRGATIQVGPWRLPLMVQDYIGSLNVLLAVPFLTLGGVNVVALRWLPVLTAGLTLLLAWRIAWRLGGAVAAIVTALLLAVSPTFIFWSRQGIFVTNLTALLFMAALLTGLRWWLGRRPIDFWLTAFLCGLGIYAKLLFVWAVGALGAAAVVGWIAGRRSPTADRRPQMADGGGQVAARGERESRSTASRLMLYAVAVVAFLLPLVPLILFNMRTGGTLQTLFGNLGRSYYGVDNTAFLPNLLVRARQVVTLLRGDHFWYLGGVYANTWAPWAASGLWLAAVVWRSGQWIVDRGQRTEDRGQWSAVSRQPSAFAFLLPPGLLGLMVAQSAFTVSDLFITHHATALPLLALAGGLAAAALWPTSAVLKMRPFVVATLVALSCDERLKPLLRRFSSALVRPVPHVTSVLGIGRGRAQTSADCSSHLSAFIRVPCSWGVAARAGAVILALLLWAGGDLWTTLRYHRALTATGGHAGHSDAIVRLAEYLRAGGLTAPVALDWGFDAQVRFLTAGQVTPIEVFGYASLVAPDPGFPGRVGPFLANPGQVFIAHADEATVFRGRVAALAALAQAQGLVLREEIRFAERSGRPLFVLYRIAPAGHSDARSFFLHSADLARRRILARVS